MINLQRNNCDADLFRRQAPATRASRKLGLEAQPTKMLAKGKIDLLDTHLEEFKLKDQSRQLDLQVRHTPPVPDRLGAVLTFTRTY